MDVCFLLDGSAVCHQILNELGDTFSKVLLVEDGEASDMPSCVDVNINPSKCLNKCATFPPYGGIRLPCSSSPLEDEMPELESQQLFSGECTSNVYARSSSFPPALEPPSAMKGSREKRGASIGKMRVTWAPEVYDPRPTSLSHSLSHTAKQRMAKKDKKKGKKGHKGKNSSKAGDSKKKKQQHGRISASSSSTTNRCCNLPNYDYIRNEGTKGFEIGSRETCGSRYLMNSLAKGPLFSCSDPLRRCWLSPPGI